MKIKFGKLYSPAWKIQESLENISNGNLSKSDGPISVSYNPELKGYRIINGHHRVLEGFLKGNKTFEAKIDEHIPKMHEFTMQEEKLVDLIKSNSEIKNIINRENIKNFLQSKSGVKTFTLYHGTNRKFKQHDIGRHRTVLNDKYQGDWICYSDNPDVAWKYAYAARNQNIDQLTFLNETNEILKKQSKSDIDKYIYQLTEYIINDGYESAWDKVIHQYIKDHQLDQDIGAREFFLKIREYEKYSNNNFDINDYCDILQYIEYSKYNDEPEDNLINIFNQTLPEIPYSVIEDMQKMGFAKSIPEPKVIISEVTATNILETNDPKEARSAKNKGYDLVIYGGGNTVDGEKEYLIKDIKQIKTKEMIIENIDSIDREPGLEMKKTSRMKVKI